MNDTDKRNALARLPQWAQRELADQNRKIAELTRQVTMLSEGPADSDVIQHDYVYPSRPLGKGATIRFLMGGDGEYIEVKHYRGGAGYLEIRGSGGSRETSALAAQPQVSNVLRIRLAENW